MSVNIGDWVRLISKNALTNKAIDLKVDGKELVYEECTLTIEKMQVLRSQPAIKEFMIKEITDKGGLIFHGLPCVWPKCIINEKGY